MDSPLAEASGLHRGILRSIDSEGRAIKKPTPTYVCLAVDLAKQVFQVAGQDAHGKVVYEDRVKSRDAFSKLLKSLGPEVEVLMESGPGAQARARRAQ